MLGMWKGCVMTIRELIKELLKDELRLDDEIRFYYMKQDELFGCEIESIAYRDQVEFTIQDEEEL
jgi:hypothetical protein